MTHGLLSRLLDGELTFAELAHFAGQYLHVVAERHAAERVALRRLRFPGGDDCRRGASAAKLWLQFTIAAGGVPGAHPHRSTRACARELRELCGDSVGSAVGVVIAIDRTEAAMAACFRDQGLRDVYHLESPRAVEYFEQWPGRRDRFLEAVETEIHHPDALAAYASARAALDVFLHGPAALPRWGASWS